MQSRQLIGFGAVFAFLGVAAGAFGAHALRDQLSPASMAIYQTGVQYQMAHALALVALGSQGVVKAEKAGWLFVAGIVIFSGSLYALAISRLGWFGAITPIGGVCFLFGWGFVAWGALRGDRKSQID